MKKLILSAIIPLTALWSCDLNYVPLEQMSAEEAFKDSLRLEMFVNDLYVYLNTGVQFNRVGGAMYDCVSDLAVYSPLGTSSGVNAFTRATMNAASGGNPDSRWAETYTGIRKANVILRNIDYTENLSQSKKNQYLGETILNKALMHYELVKRYGGIPIMDDLLDLSGDINIPRSTFEECVEYIVRLCDQAAPLLPTKYPDNDYGRLTRGAAYGLKAKILLMAASPLFNENPIEGSTEIHRYASPDHDRWKRAADAALQVIELKNPDGTKAHELYPSYQRLFFTNFGNTESIIVKCRSFTNDVEKANGPAGYQNCRACTSVTTELLDMYELKSGLLPADDPDYDPQKPYENRDERFYASVLYSGVALWGREVEFWEGGKDYPASIGQRGCETGFSMYKQIDPLASVVPSKLTLHNHQILRYAEVLLIYAEAMNEYLGNSDDEMCTEERIYTCVNEVRQRAGQPPVSNLTKGQMRELIHRERTVELAFEEHRLYDLKRWREAETVLNRPVHGIKVTLENGNVVYGEKFVVEERSFPMRMYYYPIPQSELDKNRALVINPGW